MNKSDKKKIEEIKELIGTSKKAVILTHTNPDGDAVGSSLGLREFLEFKGLRVRIFINGGIPDNLKFLAGSEEITIFDETEHRKILTSADIIFILDLNDSSRLKSIESTLLMSKAYKIVIDHHLEPKDFADLYLVDTEASSTGELIWMLITSDKDFKLSKDAADALYVAIMTDTGSFRFPRTDENVHKIIARLINSGADPVRNYDEVYNKQSLESVKLLGEGFASLESYCGGKLLLMTLTRNMFERTGAMEDDIENFVERLMFIKDSLIGILITQVPTREELRISFRSKGTLSVRELARLYGGGGHVNAAGARIYDSSAIEKTKKSLIDEASELINNSNKEKY